MLPGRIPKNILNLPAGLAALGVVAAAMNKAALKGRANTQLERKRNKKRREAPSFYTI